MSKPEFKCNLDYITLEKCKKLGKVKGSLQKAFKKAETNKKKAGLAYVYADKIGFEGDAVKKFPVKEFQFSDVKKAEVGKKVKNVLVLVTASNAKRFEFWILSMRFNTDAAFAGVSKKLEIKKEIPEVEDKQVTKEAKENKNTPVPSLTSSSSSSSRSVSPLSSSTSLSSTRRSSSCQPQTKPRTRSPSPPRRSSRAPVYKTTYLCSDMKQSLQPRRSSEEYYPKAYERPSPRDKRPVRKMEEDHFGRDFNYPPEEYYIYNLESKGRPRRASSSEATLNMTYAASSTTSYTNKMDRGFQRQVSTVCILRPLNHAPGYSAMSDYSNSSESTVPYHREEPPRTIAADEIPAPRAKKPVRRVVEDPIRRDVQNPTANFYRYTSKSRHGSSSSSSDSTTSSKTSSASLYIPGMERGLQRRVSTASIVRPLNLNANDSVTSQDSFTSESIAKYTLPTKTLVVPRNNAAEKVAKNRKPDYH